jgi:hypothetical protein
MRVVYRVARHDDHVSRPRCLGVRADEATIGEYLLSDIDDALTVLYTDRVDGDVRPVVPLRAHARDKYIVRREVHGRGWR